MLVPKIIFRIYGGQVATGLTRQVTVVTSDPDPTISRDLLANAPRGNPEHGARGMYVD